MSFDRPNMDQNYVEQRECLTVCNIFISKENYYFLIKLKSALRIVRYVWRHATIKKNIERQCYKQISLDPRFWDKVMKLKIPFLSKKDIISINFM